MSRSRIMSSTAASYHGTPYTIELTSQWGGWQWSCVVDGLLKGKSTQPCDDESDAERAAHAEAQALIDAFFPRSGAVA